MKKEDNVVDRDLERALVVAVPLPAQGHLNQMLQFSCLVASYGIPIHYLAFAAHNHQARLRCADKMSPRDMARIRFHDIQFPPIPSPNPDPDGPTKFPTHFIPMFRVMLSMREPVAAYLREMSTKFERVVVIHDFCMAAVVQDVISIANAEPYVLPCVSASFMAMVYLKDVEKKASTVAEFWEGLPSVDELLQEEVKEFQAAQIEALERMAPKSGDIFNTCRAMEAMFLEMLEKTEYVGRRKLWAVGPTLPMPNKDVVGTPRTRHECLEWLDEQDPKSIAYVSFGTMTSFTNAEIIELAKGLEDSKVKFLWVLREADKANVHDDDREVRRPELPDGFEERTKSVGMVVRDWAPQLEILAHPSTGGFLSHCGWNSCVESISMGVPMATWPMHSDQPMNARLVSQVLKTGIVVKEWSCSTRVVEASIISSVLRRLMVSEEGKEIRKRAEELGARVRKATQPGGTSRLELDSFIAHITR
ncbi:zeatin O-xylosyltransferase-like [Andrographis paniculata]|uniref:zeatin O-xylosyltransferase-like n=1 Tax=Andrographis paniculata TaxID=175694 RepID=UPI0021E95903|nr:zeatin O-xylosyltransferase-like [Andrographis paniculata]